MKRLSYGPLSHLKLIRALFQIVLEFRHVSFWEQGERKVSFTACHSGKLWLKCTSPQVISTSPQTLFD